MTLLSALDDFVCVTLAALPGLLNKLRYLSGMRSSNGNYEHWGMTLVHGEQAAQRAMAQAHSDLFLDLLRTPLSELFSETGQDGSDFEEVRGLPGSRMLIPSDLAGGSALHFSSVLDALSALAQAHCSANREAA